MQWLRRAIDPTKDRPQLVQPCRRRARHGLCTGDEAREFLKAVPLAELVGLPPGAFALPIFDTVLNGFTVRGSIVGTRLDLQEALNFAGEGKVKATVAAERLENINESSPGCARGTFRAAS